MRRPILLFLLALTLAACEGLPEGPQRAAGEFPEDDSNDY